MNIKEQIINLPKVELHCHLDGSLRPETVLDLCLKENINIPYENPEDFKSSLKISKNCSSLKEYLEKFYFPIRVMQKKKIYIELLWNFLRIQKKMVLNIPK